MLPAATGPSAKPPEQACPSQLPRTKRNIATAVLQTYLACSTAVPPPAKDQIPSNKGISYIGGYFFMDHRSSAGFRKALPRR
jgi:hypothetical protein